MTWRARSSAGQDRPDTVDRTDTWTERDDIYFPPSFSNFRNESTYQDSQYSSAYNWHCYVARNSNTESASGQLQRLLDQALILVST